uniref:Glutamate receptor 2.6-like n=1 Tax=Nicotiana sylvestris TaxID=4096 RepID=A0A1U7WNP7_NICSY|nr:PREDICTED: glutamate receptor 2.6-like [Nicotiana sylvestris]
MCKLMVFTHRVESKIWDTTIVSNRSQYVDFILPYAESGFTMMVPIKEEKIVSNLARLVVAIWFLASTTNIDVNLHNKSDINANI